MHCSPKHSVSVFFVFCPALYIDQALLLNFCSKYQYFSCFPWSGLYLLLGLLSHPISLFLVICFELPITQPPYNLNFFGFSLWGLGYWESIIEILVILVICLLYPKFQIPGCLIVVFRDESLEQRMFRWLTVNSLRFPFGCPLLFEHNSSCSKVI